MCTLRTSIIYDPRIKLMKNEKMVISVYRIREFFIYLYNKSKSRKKITKRV